ncbi:MAG: ABC transporter permease [Longimicrobiales bacterium]
METFWKDVQHGARLLARSKGVSAIAILTLSVGIGLTTALFSIVYGVLFRGLPFADGERIMYVQHNNLPAGHEGMGIPSHDYRDYAREQRAFEGLAALYPVSASVSGIEHADRVAAARITANTFEVLRVQPLRGRAFTAAEDVRAIEPVAIIGHALWQNRYHADAQIIGKVIRVNGRPTTIVGVMPEGFRFPNNQQMWLPLELDPLTLQRGARPMLEVFGRLQPGRSASAAMAELSAIATRLERDHPATNKDVRPVVSRFTDVYIGEQAIALLLTMLGAVFFVLLIACTNVASLSLSRAILRSKEVGIRSALGASRRRIITQFLTEALVLSVVGSLLGVMIAWLGIMLFNSSLEPTRIPFFVSIRLDGTAMLFVFGLALLTTLLAGTIPSLQAARSDVMSVMKDGARGSSSFRLGRTSRALVVFEIALSCGLLVAAGLTTRSLVSLRNVDLGFDHDGVIVGLLQLAAPAYSDSSRPVFYQRLNERLAALPGITAATLASSVPGLGDMFMPIAVEGRRYQREQDHPYAMRVAVLPTYLQTLGVTVLEGRDFTEADRRGAPAVAVVSRDFVRRHFPTENPLGRRIQLRDPEQEPSAWLTIVGIAPAVRLGELAGFNETESVLVPLAQHPEQHVWVMARSQADDASVTANLRTEIAAIDRDLPFDLAQPLRATIDQDTWHFPVFGGVFMIFGLIALALAAVGMYGVMAFSVSQRTRELAVRMAVGAQAGQVQRMILRQGVAQVAVGLLLGLGFAAAVSQLLSVILFDVDARDPLIFGTVVLVLIMTALLACIVPARRATALEPLKALRHE